MSRKINEEKYQNYTFEKAIFGQPRLNKPRIAYLFHQLQQKFWTKCKKQQPEDFEKLKMLEQPLRKSQ